VSHHVDVTPEAAARLLRRARCPAFLLGPECRTAITEIVELADDLGAAILTTPDAISLVAGDRSSGVFSFGASDHAKHVMAKADVVLAASPLGEFACRMGEAFSGHTLIHVTDRESDVGRNSRPEVALVGPIEATIQHLRRALTPRARRPHDRWAERTRTAKHSSPPAVRPGYIHPAAAIDALRAALPARARVCLDITSGSLHAYQKLELTPDQRAFSSIENSACMGEALMASIGVRMASGMPTLVLTGDWCYCMAPAEIHTAVELGLGGYVVVVWSNGGGAFIATGVQKQGLVVPERAWRWQHSPAFSEVARAYGARGVLVTDAASLEREVRDGLRDARPLLVEARIDSSVPVPAGDRFLSLAGEGATSPTREA
jgi:thiamine pyrophosphate-dependent acetolactate synthase large subunit-like protein